MFKFRIPTGWRVGFQTLVSISPNMYTYDFIMADSLPKAQDVAMYYRDAGIKTIIVTLSMPQAGFGGKELAFKALKDFCDIIGKPYVVASVEHLKIFGSTQVSMVNKGVVANNLMYRANGIADTSKTWVVSNTNGIVVNATNKEKTIGIPVYNGVVMDITYTNKISNSSILLDIKNILGLIKEDKAYSVVYIPKTHKKHLDNTIDVFTWAKTIKLPKISHIPAELRRDISRDYFPSFEKSCDLTSNFKRYIKEVDTILSYVDNTTYITSANRLSIPIVVDEFKPDDWFNTSHVLYDPLKVVGNNYRYNQTHAKRFEKLLRIVEKDYNV